MRALAQPSYGWKLFWLFAAISGLYVLIVWLTNTYLLTDEVYMRLWGGQLSSDRLQKMLDVNKKMQWIVYIAMPAIIYLKLLLIVLAIQAGLFLYEIELPFKKIFNIVLFAEIIPLLTTAIQFIYFLYRGVNSFDEINSFTPLSLLSIFGAGHLPSYLDYPLQVINVFELAYWILLAVGLKMYIGKSFGKSLRLVASSYGVGLLLWIVLVVFIEVQSS